MTAAVIGVGGALFLAIVGASWHLGSRLAKVEGRLEYLINGTTCAKHREEIRAAIRRVWSLYRLRRVSWCWKVKGRVPDSGAQA